MKKTLLRGISVLLLLLLTALAGAWLALRGSLPQLDGQRIMPGLHAAVQVERDALGVVGIHAENDEDMARALGFVHAQERFFQMDLLRRNSAGELAALFGPAALGVDRARRLFRFRHVATAVYAALPPADQQVLQAYAGGVNAGLAGLRVRPFPYLLLHQRPRPWQAEDSLLAVYSMYLDLNDETDAREQALSRMHATLDPAVYRFLTQDGTRWDATLDGSQRTPLPVPEATANHQPIPNADHSDGSSTNPGFRAGLVPGSNNFALSGARSASGAALVGNDMHLVLRNPGTWFRASLSLVATQPSRAYTATGVTLPGTPFLIAGSNTHVAWGFTNSYGDWVDRVRLKQDAQNPNRYRTPGGWKEIELVTETLEVAGGKPEHMDIQQTIWGPVFGKDLDGASLVLAWTAQRVPATNLVLGQFVHAKTVAQLLELANRAGSPVQNIVAGDAEGHIGWTLMGRIPRRGDHNPNLPADWSEPGSGWQGWLEARQYPRVIDPVDGQLWSANARTMGGEALAKIGDGGYALGARAQQIRDDLKTLSQAKPMDFLDIQLDDRAVFLSRWRGLLIDVLQAMPGGEPALERVRNWGGHAAVDSVGYRLVRAFRQRVIPAAVKPMLAPVRARFPDFRAAGMRQWEGAVWALLTDRPDAWLDAAYASWDALLRAAAQRAIADITPTSGHLAQATWGARNRVAVRHPLSRAVPYLARWLDMPVAELPGDSNMPRVQGPSFGASERFAVSPGHEQDGYFHMPGGQSGHPLSPFFGAGHSAWATGKPLPFLPGATRHSLCLKPG